VVAGARDPGVRAGRGVERRRVAGQQRGDGALVQVGAPLQVAQDVVVRLLPQRIDGLHGDRDPLHQALAHCPAEDPRAVHVRPHRVVAVPQRVETSGGRRRRGEGRGDDERGEHLPESAGRPGRILRRTVPAAETVQNRPVAEEDIARRGEAWSMTTTLVAVAPRPRPASWSGSLSPFRPALLVRSEAAHAPRFLHFAADLGAGARGERA
jgi:hypothetical protein